MTQPQEVRCYDYVNRPYAIVRDTLRAHPNDVFARATKTAGNRAAALAASLRVELGGVELATDVAIEVLSITEVERGAAGGKMTRIDLAWRAIHRPQMFPEMGGELDVYALSSQETQLDFHGRYTAPLGLLGSAIDSMIGHQVAEASVLRFVQDVGKFLRDELPKT